MVSPVAARRLPGVVTRDIGDHSNEKGDPATPPNPAPCAHEACISIPRHERLKASLP